MQTNIASGLQGSHARNQANSSHRWSFAPSLWAQNAVSPASVGTQILTIGVPDDFYAVRVGYINMTTTPYTVTKTVAVPSTTWANYVLPTGSAGQTVLTTNASGVDDARIYAKSAGNTTSLTVLANTTDPISGITDKAAVSWTDWTPCVNTTPDPATGMRVLMLRCLIPASQTLTFGNGTASGLSGGRFTPKQGTYDDNGGMDIFIGGINSQDRTVFPYASDTSSAATTASYAANGIVNGNLMAIVQVLTRNEGFTIAQVGESKFYGTGVTSGINNWCFRAVQELNKQYIGKVPFGYCGFAVGGYDSAHTYGLSRDVMAAIAPSFVNICSYNGNENLNSLGYPDLASIQTQFARTLEFVNYCRSLGAVPILNSPLPMVLANSVQTLTGLLTSVPSNAGFQYAFNAWKVIAQQNSVPTMDLYRVLGADWEGADPHYGNIAWSTDGNHPNDLGNTHLVQPFLDMLMPLMSFAL